MQSAKCAFCDGAAAAAGAVGIGDSRSLIGIFASYVFLHTLQLTAQLTTLSLFLRAR